MKAWAMVEASAPLLEIQLPTHVPMGSELVIEVTHCAVCNSDVAFWMGKYNPKLRCRCAAFGDSRGGESLKLLWLVEGQVMGAAIGN